MTSVAGSDGVSILVVAPASNPEGAVNRRSGSSGASFDSGSADMTSVAGSWSGSEDAITSVAGSARLGLAQPARRLAASVTSSVTSSG